MCPGGGELSNRQCLSKIITPSELRDPSPKSGHTNKADICMTVKIHIKALGIYKLVSSFLPFSLLVIYLHVSKNTF